jgi:hypothetical protein
MELMDMQKCQIAWNFFLKSCEKHGISTNLSFYQFIQSVTVEQLESMVRQSELAG